MPRIVSAAEKAQAINLMLAKNETGKFIFGQRDIERETGLSRPYLRKLARSIGHQFPRNGIEVVGKLCMCTNCGTMFRRPPSKVERAKHQFCDELCKVAYMKGANHPMWKTGKTAATFSTWIKNQAGYQKWRDAVLERDGYMCAISSRTDNLDVHHIIPKQEGISPERALDVSNGITMNREVHERVHELIRQGHEFEEAITILKKEYGTDK